MNNQGNQQVSMRQIMENSEEIRCQNCGGMFFRSTQLLRKISPLLTNNGQPAVMPIPVWRCDDCETPLDQMKPEDDKESNDTEDKSSGLKIIT